MRFFLWECPPGAKLPTPGEEILFSTAESHHLLKVIRTQRGETVNLTDGQGSFYRGVLAGQTGNRARISIRSVQEDLADTRRPHLALACAVVKGRRFAWVLEKSVELGVHEIWPLQTDRTVVAPGPGRQARWRTIVKTALKQSGRAYLPRVHPVTDLAACLGSLPASWIAYGDLAPETADPTFGPLPARDEVQSRLDPTGLVSHWEEPPPICIWVVGPEGGWSESERSLLAERANLALTLGPHRLRTETAATAGLILMQIWRQSWWERPPDRPLP